jgi:hypothetical protein
MAAGGTLSLHETKTDDIPQVCDAEKCLTSTFLFSKWNKTKLHVGVAIPMFYQNF